MTRQLSDNFMKQLMPNGELNPMVCALQRLPQLRFFPRGKYATVYYKAARLFEIYPNSKYPFRVTKKYKDYAKLTEMDGFNSALTGFNPNNDDEFNLGLGQCDEQFWYNFFIRMMCGVNEHRLVATEREKEIQQLIFAENNDNKRPTDYLMLDIEYAVPGDRSYGQFDIVALKWPANKRNDDKYQPELAIIEVKHGDKALMGNSGMQDHLNKISRFQPSPEFYADLETVLNQLRQLGFVKLARKPNVPVKINTDEGKKQFIFALGNCSNRSSNLRRAVNSLNEISNYQLRFVTASLMGYGLYEDGMLTLGKFKKMLDAVNSDSDDMSENMP